MNKRQRGRNRWNPRTHLLPLLLLHPRSPDLPPNRRPTAQAPLPSLLQHSTPALATTGPYAAAHGIRCPTKEAARGAEGIRGGAASARPRRRRGWGSGRNSTRRGRVQGCGALAPPPRLLLPISRAAGALEKRSGDGGRAVGERKMRKGGGGFLPCARGLLPLYDGGGRGRTHRGCGWVARWPAPRRPICIFA